MNPWDNLSQFDQWLSGADTQEYLPRLPYNTGSQNSPAWERSFSPGAMRDRTNQMIAESNANQDRDMRALLGIGTALAQDTPEQAFEKQWREIMQRNQRPAYSYTWEEGATQKGVPIRQVKGQQQGYDPNEVQDWERISPTNAQWSHGGLGTAYNNPIKRGPAVTETTGPMSKFSSSPFWGPSAREPVPLVPGSDPEMFSGSDDSATRGAVPAEATVQGAHIPGLLRYLISVILNRQAQNPLPQHNPWQIGGAGGL